MHVLLFGTYDTSLHPRIATIAEGLRAHGIDVAECNAPLGLDTAARVDMLAHPWRAPALLGRLARRWATLARAASQMPAPDVVLVGYLGHFDVHHLAGEERGHGDHVRRRDRLGGRHPQRQHRPGLSGQAAGRREDLRPALTFFGSGPPRLGW